MDPAVGSVLCCLGQGKKAQVRGLNQWTVQLPFASRSAQSPCSVTGLG